VNAHSTVGFGCPNDTDPHHFTVEIPGGRHGFVVITEHYGIRAGINGRPEFVERCRLPKPVWAQIAEHTKRHFNDRLKEKKLASSRWVSGINKVERLLGKELCVLAWALEFANSNKIPNAIRNWIGFRPEERWWLFTMTAAATGGVDDGEVGWRKALRFALTENPTADDSWAPARPRQLALMEETSPFASPADLPLFEDGKERT
jgi:hypothetical protein